MRRFIIAASLLLVSPAAAQQGVPFFPQTLPTNTVVGRLSSGPGPTEAIQLPDLLSALFPVGSIAYAFNAASVAFQGSVNGAVTVKGQAAAGTWTLLWPTTVGVTGRCLGETVSGSVATTSWNDCASLSANNTWTGTDTFNGNLTVNSLANFTGTFQKSGTTQVFPASGNLVGTSDPQTLTNKSISGNQINSGTLPAARLPLTNTTFTAAATTPTGTSSASPLMLGAGVTNCKLTPTYSGRVHVHFGMAASNSAGASLGVTYSLRYGTGTAPANGAAATGTIISGPFTYTSDSGNTRQMVLSAIVSGLTPGTAYWFDFSQTSDGTHLITPTYGCDGFEF